MSTTTNTTEPLTTAKVGRVLKAAGLTSADSRSGAKAGIRGYSVITRQGFMLQRETEFKRVTEGGETRKAHVPTGRVEVHVALSGWNPDEAAAGRDMAAAREALTAKGWTVTDGHGPRTILVGA